MKGERKRVVGLSEVVKMPYIEEVGLNTVAGNSRGRNLVIDRQSTYYVLLRNMERILRQCEEERVTMDSITVRPEVVFADGAYYRITVEGVEGINLF